LLAPDPAVASIEGGNYGSVIFHGTEIPAVAVDLLKGTEGLTIVEGRAPHGAGEVALGTATLHSIHRTIGDSIALDTGSGTIQVKIVGRALFPALGHGSFSPTGLGIGAEIGPASVLAQGEPAHSYNFVLIGYVPNADRRPTLARVCAALAATGVHCGTDVVVGPPQRPAELTTYARTSETLFVVAALLGVFAILAITHALVLTIRRRRRDLALLKTIGFVRRQLLATVEWQATTFVVVAGAIGLPIGVVTGRWVWSIFARRLGVPPSPAVPVVLSVATIPAVLLAAMIAAALPGSAAARIKAAPALRAE
jgi:putative ABC transport system permease protein